MNNFSNARIHADHGNAAGTLFTEPVVYIVIRSSSALGHTDDSPPDL